MQGTGPSSLAESLGREVAQAGRDVGEKEADPGGVQAGSREGTAAPAFRHTAVAPQAS